MKRNFILPTGMATSSSGAPERITSNEELLALKGTTTKVVIGFLYNGKIRYLDFTNLITDGEKYFDTNNQNIATAVRWNVIEPDRANSDGSWVSFIEDGQSQIPDRSNQFGSNRPNSPGNTWFAYSGQSVLNEEYTENHKLDGKFLISDRQNIGFDVVNGNKFRVAQNIKRYEAFLFKVNS